MRYKNTLIRFITIGLLGGISVAAQATTYTVNQFTDAPNATCTGTVCTSLRAAISRANLDMSDDVINLSEGTYYLSLAGASEDNNATGDLDIKPSGKLTISGKSAQTTVISAKPNASGTATDRVFHVRTNTNFVLNNLTVADGVGDQGGGISACYTNVTLNNVTVTRNISKSSQGGGGIYVCETHLTLDSSTVSHNNSQDRLGGGIYIDRYSTVEINDSSISENTASGGGAIYVRDNSTAVLSRSTIASNESRTTQGGSGIKVEGDGAVTIVNDSTFSGSLYWSVVDVRSGGDITLNNVTISENKTSAIYLYTATATLNNSTITGNTESDRVINVEYSTLNLRNTVVANNQSDIPEIEADCYNYESYINSTGSNFVQEPGTCILNNPNDVLGGDPLVGALDDNGGSVKTVLPLPGSPLIDAIPVEACTDIEGNLVETDARGVLRPQGSSCDIGAVEMASDTTARYMAPSESFLTVFPKTIVKFVVDAIDDDNNINDVSFYIDDTLMASVITPDAATGKYTYDWTAAIGKSRMTTVKAVATSTDGTSAVATVMVQVLSGRPTH